MHIAFPLISFSGLEMSGKNIEDGCTVRMVPEWNPSIQILALCCMNSMYYCRFSNCLFCSQKDGGRSDGCS